MIKRLYEKLTGTPWTTSRTASAEFGPTIAARHPELAALSDRELYALTPHSAIAYAQAVRASAQATKSKPANTSRLPVGV